MCADATYKILWQGFPLIVVGFIDREKHFHVIAIVVTSNERTSEYEFVFRYLKKGIEQQSKQPFLPEVLTSDYAKAIRNMRKMTTDISGEFSKGERGLKSERAIKDETFEKAWLLVPTNFIAFKFEFIFSCLF